MKAKKLTDAQVHELDAVECRAIGVVPPAESTKRNLESIRAVIDAYEQMREPEPIAGNVVHRMLEANYFPEGLRLRAFSDAQVAGETRAAHVLLDAVSGKVTDEEREAWNKISRVDASVSSFCHWLINRRIFRMLAPERTPEERVTVRKEENLPHLLVCIDGEIMGRFGNEQTAQDLREGIIARMKREQGAK